jgi:hypothetical protein
VRSVDVENHVGFILLVAVDAFLFVYDLIVLVTLWSFVRSQMATKNAFSRFTIALPISCISVYQLRFVLSSTT